MPRPCKRRMVDGNFPAWKFKPAGIPARCLEEVCLGVDELEALRLADAEGLYQSEAAERMGVSRATFGNIVASARKKVADALVNGKAIRIEGGAVDSGTPRRSEMPGGDGTGPNGMGSAGGGGRGMGRVGGAGAGAGPAGRCVCAKCGYSAPHQRGVPCATATCPKCGATMTRQA
jgi:predicted DNA-binding protein (UPF0251 family)